MFGVGLNNWSWWITKKYSAMAGYYTTDRARDLIPYPSTRFGPDRGEFAQLAPAHNLYLLTVTELGWPGLILLMAFLMKSAWISGRVLIGRRDSSIALVRLGVFLSICGVLLQSWTEWEFRQTSMFFLGHIVMAVGATLYHYCGKTSRT